MCIRDRWIPVTESLDVNTIVLNVGKSSDTSTHVYQTATSGGLKVQTGYITVNVGKSPTVSHNPSSVSYNPATGNMDMTIGNHYLRGGSQHTASTASYEASTGIMTVTVANHGFSIGDYIKFAENSITFTCTMNGNATNKQYPRSTDPSFNKWLAVVGITTDTFQVNVGASPLVKHNVTTATYDPATGLIEATIGSHTLEVGEPVMLKDYGFTFTCGLDGDTVAKTYPRETGFIQNAGVADPAWRTPVVITAKSATTITFNVGTSSDVTAHNWDGGTSSEAIISGGDYNHTFVTASTNGVYSCLLYTSPSPRD